MLRKLCRSESLAAFSRGNQGRKPSHFDFVLCAEARNTAHGGTATMVLVQITLREYRPQDFDTLWSIDQTCFPVGIAYSRRELAGFMRLSGTFTLVAELVAARPAENPIAGFIIARCRRNRAGHVITIDVSSRARRSGVGSQLLTAAENRLQTAGCERVYLETAVDNVPALSFYKRHHYFVTKTVPGYYSNGVDAFVLEKDLLSQVHAS